METRTKIICTIGPSVNTKDKIIELIQAGMNVARLNLSHGTHELHLEAINHLKEARKTLGKPLAIMLDTKGPEIRIGKIAGGLAALIPGQKWFLTKEELEGGPEQVSIIPGDVLEKLTAGAKVLFDDGYISSQVIEVNEKGVVVQIENGGFLKSSKGVNIPNVSLDLPAVTERDIDDIRFGCREDIDIIAASFVRSAEHVLQIKKLLDEEKKPDILVVAKIENSEGIQNFDSIVQVADGIMIARGDLGVEVPISVVPRLQKMMINKCYLAGKPVVTATQMLESMINSPRPTRAEVSDVVNAIYDSTSSVMLSGETAVGKFPLETLNVMASLVRQAEEDFNYEELFSRHSRFVYHDVPSALTLASVKTAYSSQAKAIFAFTSRGATARLISRLRPSMPIVAMTPNEKCYHQLAFVWGVVPFLSNDAKTIDEAFLKSSQFALEQGLVSHGDLVVVTAGSPFGISGTTNMMLVENIGDVLVRGQHGFGPRIYGKVALVLATESRKPYTVRGRLLVIAKCDESYLPFIREASGVILQNHVKDEESEQFLLGVAKELNKPVLVRADAASVILKEGQLVTLAPEKSLVYKGVSF